MQLGLPLKQVGSFIRCPRLKVSVKCCKFFSTGIISKSPSNVMFSKLSRYLERFFDIFSKNKELFWLGGSYNTKMNHFLNHACVWRYMNSVSLSKCKFDSLEAVFYFTYIQSHPPKQFLSCLNILSCL